MFDLVIIGAGPGGYELALEARKKNLTVLLIEEEKLGGTCLNWGCIPTKTYYKHAQLLREIKRASLFGIHLEGVQVDFARFHQRKEEVVKKLQDGIAFLLQKEKVDWIKGHATLIDSHTVEVNNETYQGKYIIIATGSKPIELKGLEQAITSQALLDLQEVPSKLAIIGAGVIGMELACIFQALGSQVQIVEYMDCILPSADKELAKRMLSYLKSQNIQVHLKSKATAYQNNILQFEKNNQIEEISCDVLLQAVGRKANFDEQACEKIGIAYTAKGITVNEHFQTSIPTVYAIGDCTGKLMLAHYATYSGYHVLHHILGEESAIRFDLTPSCVFSFPEMAWVGKTEEECKDEPYQVVKSFYRSNGKAIASEEQEGFVKLILKDNKIIGAHIIGHEASILIHELAVLMHTDQSIQAMQNIIHAHPTLSEIIGNCLKIAE